LIATRNVRLKEMQSTSRTVTALSVDHADENRAIVTSNLTIRPRVVRYADAAMRALLEHRRARSGSLPGAASPTVCAVGSGLNGRRRDVGAAASPRSVLRPGPDARW